MWLNKKTDFVDSMWQVNETEIRKIDESVVRELSDIFNFWWIKSKTLQNIFLVTIWYPTIDFNKNIESFSINWLSMQTILEYGIDNIIKSAYIEQFYRRIISDLCVFYARSQTEKINELIDDAIDFFWSIWLKEYEHKMIVIREIFLYINVAQKDLIKDYIKNKSNEASIKEVIELIYFFRSLQRSINKFNQIFLVQLLEILIINLIKWKAVSDLIENIYKSNWTQQKILLQKWHKLNNIIDDNTLIQRQLPWLWLQI